MLTQSSIRLDENAKVPDCKPSPYSLLTYPPLEMCAPFRDTIVSLDIENMGMWSSNCQQRVSDIKRGEILLFTVYEQIT